MIAFKTHHQAWMKTVYNLVSRTTKARQNLFYMMFIASGGAVVIHAIFMGMCRSPWELVLLFLRVIVTVFKTLALFVARGCTTKFPNWSLRFELVQAAIRVCTHSHGERMAIQKHTQWIRVQSDVLRSVLGRLSRRQFNRSLEAVHFNGLEHVCLRNKQPRPNGVKRLVVLCLHGGGFAVLSPRLYISLGAALASTTEKELGKLANGNGSDLIIDLLLGNYSKAPEYCFPTQPEDVVNLYEKYLLQHERLSPSQIILAGDSSGGGLLTSILLRLRDAKPGLLLLAAMLISPAVDLTGDEPDAPDCFLSRRMCKAFTDAYHPTHTDPSTWEDASSAQCDLRCLPPVFLQVGRFDYVFQHGSRLASKAEADKVTNWELDFHDDMPHVFSIFPNFVLPYAQIGVQNLAAFAAKNLVKSENHETRARSS